MRQIFFKKNSNKYPSQGFTLIEALMVVALNTVLMLVITSTISQLYQNHSYTFEQSNEIEVARKGVGVWMRDAREMTLSANGGYPIVKVGTSTMGFYGDIDKDSSVEYVEYQLVGTTIYKYTYNPTGSPVSYSTTTPDQIETLSEYVRNTSQGASVFKYYDSSGIEVSSPSAMISDISYITISVIVNIDPLRSPGEFMLKGSVAPRNIKTNL